jgi:hypothetical protein
MSSKPAVDNSLHSGCSVQGRASSTANSWIVIAMAGSCQAALQARETAFSWAGGLIVVTGFAGATWRVVLHREAPRVPRTVVGAATACLLVIAAVFAAATGVAGGGVLADVGHSCPSLLEFNVDLGPVGDAIFIAMFVLLCCAPLLGGALVAGVALHVLNGNRLGFRTGALVGAATSVVALVVTRSRSLEGVALLPALVLVVAGAVAAASCLATLLHSNRRG